MSQTVDATVRPRPLRHWSLMRAAKAAISQDTRYANIVKDMPEGLAEDLASDLLDEAERVLVNEVQDYLTYVDYEPCEDRRVLAAVRLILGDTRWCLLEVSDPFLPPQT